MKNLIMINEIITIDELEEVSGGYFVPIPNEQIKV